MKGYAVMDDNTGVMATQLKPVHRAIDKLRQEIERVGRHVEMLEHGLEAVLRPIETRDVVPPRMSAPSNEPAVKLSVEIDELSQSIGVIADRALSIHDRLGV